MTISAPEGSAAGAGSGPVAFYRDQLLSLRGRTAQLLTHPAEGADDGDTVGAVTRDTQVLRSVFDFEAYVEKHRAAFGDGSSVALDLAAARAEVLSRLAVWFAER
jgi:hypothetical protein